MFDAKPKLRAFISSTWGDLFEYRAAVEEVLQRVTVSFESMKYFGSSEGEPLDRCLQKLDTCNYYIGIIGKIYGTVPEKEKSSITEFEYERAKRNGIPRRLYLIKESVSMPEYEAEPDEKQAKFRLFKEKILKENVVQFFSSPDQLAKEVLADLYQFMMYSTDQSLEKINYTKIFDNILKENEEYPQRFAYLIKQACNDLMGDLLPNGGWGKHNNVILKQIFSEIPSNFDTEGSITLSSWPIETICSKLLSNPATNVQVKVLEKFRQYLSERLNFVSGCSGRIHYDAYGKKHFECHPRHTATSIRCYLALDTQTDIEKARCQISYLFSKSTPKWDPLEVGVPDILNAGAIIRRRLSNFVPRGEKFNGLDEFFYEGLQLFFDQLNTDYFWKENKCERGRPYLTLYYLNAISQLLQEKIFIDFRQSFFNQLDSAISKFLLPDGGFPFLQSDPIGNFGMTACLINIIRNIGDKRYEEIARKAFYFLLGDNTHMREKSFCYSWAMILNLIDCV